MQCWRLRDNETWNIPLTLRCYHPAIRAVNLSFIAWACIDFMGVTQDYPEAVRWFRKAASQGEAFAQSKLGIMYTKGLGVTQDYVQAHMWFNLAAAQGKTTTRENREILAKKMTPTQIAEAQRLAREWKPKRR